MPLRPPRQCFCHNEYEGEIILPPGMRFRVAEKLENVAITDKSPDATIRKFRVGNYYRLEPDPEIPGQRVLSFRAGNS